MKNKTVLIILALFLLTLLSRVFLLSKGPFHYDTLDYVKCGERTIQTLRINYAHGPGYPLTVLVSALSVLSGKLFGLTAERSVIVFGAILGSFAVACFFLFVRAFSKNLPVSIFSSLIFSFSSAFYSVTTHGRIDHALECIFISLSFYYLLKNEDKGEGKYFVSVFFIGLAVVSRFSASIVGLPWLMFYFLWDKPSKSLIFPKRLILMLCAFLLPLIIFYANPSLKSVIQASRDENLAFNWLGFFNPITLMGLNWVAGMLTLLGLAIIPVGVYSLFKESRLKKLLLLLSWFIITFFYFANIGCASPRYLIWPSFPLMIIAAYGLNRIYVFKKLFGILIMSVLIYMMVSPLKTILEFRKKHNLQKEFALYVEKLIEDNSVILAKDEWIFLDEYIRNKPRLITGFPSTCDPAQMDKFLDQMDKWFAEGRNIYIVETGFGYDPCELFSAGASKKYNLRVVGEHINEDWHHKCLTLTTFMEHIFKIEPKNSSDPGKNK